MSTTATRTGVMLEVRGMLAHDDPESTRLRERRYDVGARAAMSAAIKFSLPVGLAILYGLGFVIWYELLRSEAVHLFMRRRRRRRRGKAQVAAADGIGPEQAEAAESERWAPEWRVGEQSSPDPARRHYHLARKAAVAERDAAVEAAAEATKQAIDRIERRYQQMDAVDSGRAREAAKAERDAAVEAAHAATKQAVERIERRYREIDWALEDEEAERIKEMLGRS
jgi:hypothetical protein